MILALAIHSLSLVPLHWTPQDPAPPAPATPVAPKAPDAPVSPGVAGRETPDAAGWQGIDGVVMIVNQDIITQRQLTKQMDMYQRRSKPITNESEVLRVRALLIRDNALGRLSEQAGQDMGIDKKLVARKVDEDMQRLKEQKNGASGLAKFLEQENLSIDELRHEYEERLYSGVWKGSKTGESGGPEARPIRDRFVRPGFLRFTFINAIDRPEAVQAIGGKPTLYTLQLLAIDPDPLGGVAKAREVLMQLRKRIEAGDDAASIIATYCKVPEKDTILQPLDEFSIRRVDGPLADFARVAKPNDFSEITLQEGADGKKSLHLWRLIERTEAVKPDLATAETQALITKNVRRSIEEYWLGTAYRQLFRSAFVWPPEAAGH